MGLKKFVLFTGLLAVGVAYAVTGKFAFTWLTGRRGPGIKLEGDKAR